MSKKKAVVICPGRGTYNKEELGYISRYHAECGHLLAAFDKSRVQRGETTLSSLDAAEHFSPALHTRGDNASGLIYACALFDFKLIDRDRYEIVAITGNSMGWYTALACAGALDDLGGFHVVNTMGGLMHRAMVGGQLIYPFVDEDWVEIPGRRAALLSKVEEIPDLYVSIHLGGMIVFAGSDEAIQRLQKSLQPVMNRFPLRLHNHAAYHSHLQMPVARAAREQISADFFQPPKIPLIDGRGHIWYPAMSDVSALYEYTLNHQVVRPFHFSRALTNSLKEFAPDALIILGPGTTLISAVAQTLIQNRWVGIADKAAFARQQSAAPFLLPLGVAEQRESVIANS